MGKQKRSLLSGRLFSYEDLNPIHASLRLIKYTEYTDEEIDSAAYAQKMIGLTTSAQKEIEEE